MAFWGIEVKPGKPFALKFDDGLRRRLHISQATLAIGSSKQTSLVQCNVGDKSPVLLCALLPDKSESLQLNLEFDEDEEVLFSVVGPRGVHLTGFYTSGGRSFNDDGSESYGEDIANSENEESGQQSDEDEYEDSFIDDDENLEVLPHCTLPTDGAVDDDIDMNKTNNKKKLKKRSMVVESDDDDEFISWQQNTGKCIRSVLKSDSEDSVPILSLCKNKKAEKNTVSESNICGDPVKNDDPKRTTPKKKSKGADSEGKAVDAANNNNEGDEAKQSEAKTNSISVAQDPIVTNEILDDPSMNKTTPKKKSKGAASEGKAVDAANNNNEGDEAKQSEAKTNSISVAQDPIVTNEILDDPSMNKTVSKKKGKVVSQEVKILEVDAVQYSDPGDKVKESEAATNSIVVSQDPGVSNEIDGYPDIDNIISNLLPKPELEVESGATPKKKRKERSKDEKIPEANTDNHTQSFPEKKCMKADKGADNVDQDLHMGNEHNQSETGFAADTLLPTVEEGSERPKKKRKKLQDKQTSTKNDLDVPGRKADENTSEKAEKKKKNKSKSKVQKNDENMTVSLNGEKENPINEVQEKNVISGSSNVRTLSNGLVIEDLESNKSDGREALQGKKLKVQYTAKLKESGEMIDSNCNAPVKFRLGDTNIMEGWNIGLEGMRAGDKRRLVVPPSLGNWSSGSEENVPPESWVIYDVEVLRVYSK
ncbi:peptidyl-prolyl cis-trans isomerase FKBP43 isoform X1 [Daucus carota subsp. sativus]|uniref:peptidyl-prolyl cis-trans isomerase FKBP43 isoform X1 n=1 Tax=Daucus carota subsp. sativus TaxID=79200 RepID=UPI0007EF570F|nr:PREDICTED: peptidyl-prolyl cis-trans isomerase FKBP43-like isoform X1 [Daucus carota subsp. sativus]